MKIKRFVAGIVGACLLLSPASAGELDFIVNGDPAAFDATDASVTFATETLADGGATVAFTGDLAYTFEFGRPADSLFFVTVTLTNAVFGAGTDVDGNLTVDLFSNSADSATADANMSSVVAFGGAVQDGESSVSFEIDLGSGATDGIEPGDVMTFRFGINGEDVDLDTDLDLGDVSATVRITRDSPSGALLDTEETTAFFSTDYAVDASINNSGSDAIDTDTGLDFEGPVTEASGTVDLTFTAGLTDATDGSVVSNLSQLGDLDVTVTGQDTGIAGVTFPNPNGGTTALTDNDDGTFTTTFGDGFTDVAGGAVTFTVTGTDVLTVENGMVEWYLTVFFDADIDTSRDRTLIDNGLLTTWTRGVILPESVVLYSGWVGTQASDISAIFQGVTLINNHDSNTANVRVEMFSLATWDSDTDTQSFSGTGADANGKLGEANYTVSGGNTLAITAENLIADSGFDLRQDITNLSIAIKVTVSRVGGVSASGQILLGSGGDWSLSNMIHVTMQETVLSPL